MIPKSVDCLYHLSVVYRPRSRRLDQRTRIYILEVTYKKFELCKCRTFGRPIVGRSVLSLANEAKPALPVGCMRYEELRR